MRYRGFIMLAAALALAAPCAFALDLPATDGGPETPAGAVHVSFEP